MAKEFWINLPVKDVQKSKAFFTELGFSFNSKYGNTDNSACMLIGQKQVVVMLFDEASFKSFTQNEISNTTLATEVLFSIDAESIEEVDEMANKAIKAGGNSNHQPYKMEGWMYGCVFTDLDGHRWNVLHMDMTNMQKNG